MMSNLKFILTLFLVSLSCNRISLVETSVCDEMEDYCIVVEISIDKDVTLFNNVKVDSVVQIRRLINEARDNINISTDRCRMAGKVYIDEDCNFSTVNSIFSEFQKASFLKIFLKVNNLYDPCWLAFNLPLYDNFRDSVCRKIMTLSNAERDSIGLLFVEYYSKDTISVNKKLVAKVEFANQIDSIIEYVEQYHYLIIPDKDKTFGEIFSLADLYLTELEKMKRRYVPSEKNPIHEYNDEAQLYYFEKKYSRKYSILYH